MANKELDRFDEHPKKNVQIATKLALIISGSAFLATVITATIALLVFNAGFIEENVMALNSFSKGIENTLKEWRGTSLSFAKVFAQDEEIFENLDSGENSAIANYIKEKSYFLDIDHIVVVNNRGIVVASGDSDLIGSDFSKVSSVKIALSGKEASTFESAGKLQFTLASAAPIKSYGQTIGAVATFYDLDDGTLVGSAQKSYNVECTIFKDNLRIDTSLIDQNGNKATGTRLENQEVLETVFQKRQIYNGKVRLMGKSYYSIYIPLEGDDKIVSGMVFVAKSIESIENVLKKTLMILLPSAALLVFILTFSSGMFIKWLMWRIKNVVNFLMELETGEADLTKRSKLFIRDEIGDLIIHFDLFLDKLQQIIKEIKDTKGELIETGRVMKDGTDGTAVAINEITKNIENAHAQISKQTESIKETAGGVGGISSSVASLDSMIEDQSSAVSQASAAVEQMVGNIGSVDTSVAKMASSFESLSENAEVGFKKQQDVNERIKQIESQSEMLLEANKTISAIANQTNLLAMNAAIEAAHAGDAGKGFAVVADEIRKLSENSSAQSKTIGQQLNGIKDSITQVFSASTETSSALSAVSECIKETDQLVAQIKGAMEEQNEGSKQIISGLKSMNDSMIEVQKASKDMAARSNKITGEVHLLEDSTAEAQTSIDEMAAGAERISRAGSALEATSSRLQEAIDKIGARIDLFKV